MSGLRWVLLGGIAGLVTAGCANAPVRVWEMDAAALQAVPESALCYAIAQGRSSRRAIPQVEFERQRRSVSCEAQIVENVSDCSKLKIANEDPPATLTSAPQGQGYNHVASVQVRNTDSLPRNFRIVWRGSLTLLLRLEAGEQRSFDVSSPPRSPVDSNGRLRSTRAWLQECVVVPGHGPRDIRW